jgi:ParB family chromosome partitioning protein
MNLDLSGLDQFKASRWLAEPPSTGAGPMDVALDLIDFDPDQPRRSFDEVALAAMAATMQGVGVLEPVALRRRSEMPGRYIVNRGERRVRAARLAGRATVPAFVDERVDRYVQVIENLHREDLSPFDLATFIAERERAGECRAEIARRLQKPASFVTELAALVGAPEAVRAVFDDGRTRDRRVLYQLARVARDEPAKVEPLLMGEGPVTRRAVDAVGQASSAASAEGGGRRVAAARGLAHALVVEHEGRRGQLRWSRPPGMQTADVEFDDGVRSVVGLAELRLVEWIGR